MKRLILSVLLLGMGVIWGQKTPSRPNFVIIMADDLGFSDIGCYGAEIKTPNLDKLASKGVKFTQFYNAARCCPSRASLLTGMYPHQAGMGTMVVTKVKDRSKETSTQGWLSKQTVTMAEVLKSAGYQTYMSGKWHVGEERPDWPLQRGFDRYFGLISGATSYYELLPGRILLEDNEPYKIPEKFYLTDAISDKAIGYIDQNRGSNQPFFLYVAYTAPHWPLHAPEEDIAQYRGSYLKGWDYLRAERLKKQYQLGLFPQKYALSPKEADLPDWSSVSNKDEWDLKMAAYAAMVSRMDAGIGKIMDKLKATGQWDNTVIVFLSDNGACAEVLNDRAQRDLGEKAYAESLTKKAGEKGSYTTYSKEWAALGNTPFRMYKQFTHEGGIATPMIVHYPALVKKPFQTQQLGHIMDIMPTCLELAKATYPSQYQQNSIKPLEGKSLVPILEGKTRTPHPYLAWEHFDCRAVRQGKWKLVWSKDTKKWELYDMENDRSELYDLAASHPAKVQELKVLYSDWTAKVGATKGE